MNIQLNMTSGDTSRDGKSTSEGEFPTRTYGRTDLELGADVTHLSVADAGDRYLPGLTDKPL